MTQEQAEHLVQRFQGRCPLYGSMAGRPPDVRVTRSIRAFIAGPSNVTSTSGRTGWHHKATELRHLRTIAAVARHRSFTKAGEELHLAQSAISQQIRRLEQEIGVEVLPPHEPQRRADRRRAA